MACDGAYPLRPDPDFDWTNETTISGFESNLDLPVNNTSFTPANFICIILFLLFHVSVAGYVVFMPYYKSETRYNRIHWIHYKRIFSPT